MIELFDNRTLTLYQKRQHGCQANGGRFEMSA
jgi:hypothetical protein